MGRGIRKKVLKGLSRDARYLAHIASSANPGFLYFLVSDQLQLVKIGASNRWDGHEVAVDKRITEVCNAAAVIPISRTIVVLAGSLGWTETELHHHFDAYRTAGEWFLCVDDLKRFVDCLDRFMKEIVAWGKGGPRPTDPPWKLLESAPCQPTLRLAGLQANYVPIKDHGA